MAAAAANGSGRGNDTAAGRQQDRRVELVILPLPPRIAVR
jgi:hypothetical protein